jgi:23S rRNA (uracil1939-C5)-methyltransferase
MSEHTQNLTPRCPHFGVCGGCQHQDLAYAEQLRLKLTKLQELLFASAISTPQLTIESAAPWEYRNRIRLRIERVDGTLRVGYNRAGTTSFLPIVVCPISAPVLLRTAEALLAAAAIDRDAAFWADAATEVELFCDHAAERVQMTLHCAPRTKAQPGSFKRMHAAVQVLAPWLAGSYAIAADPRTGPTGRTLDTAGAGGLGYRVGDESYWVTRGGFFQINRFLLQTLVDVVCKDEAGPRTGNLAWDLFAGVGLFSRVLARGFTRVTAVESNPTAAHDLRAGLAKTSPAGAAIESTTVDFLRRAVLDRDRPDLVVLDPPRAGAGVEACELLCRIAPQAIVYVSCDPETLARDLRTLVPSYTIERLHLVDLFPQTSHMETVVVLKRGA